MQLLLAKSNTGEKKPAGEKCGRKMAFWGAKNMTLE